MGFPTSSCAHSWNLRPVRPWSGPYQRAPDPCEEAACRRARMRQFDELALPRTDRRVEKVAEVVPPSAFARVQLLPPELATQLQQIIVQAKLHRTTQGVEMLLGPGARFRRRWLIAPPSDDNFIGI